MITKEQLREIAKKNKIRAYYQEKEYLQKALLFNLYQKSKKFIFKGGTCLRLVYNYARFSEDLDFNTNLKPKVIKEIVVQVLKDVELLGMKFRIKKEQEFDSSYTIHIQFEGPLYVGVPYSKNLIRLDIGERGGTILKANWMQVVSDYPDVPNFFVFAMKEEEILAEKIRTLFVRANAKDLFDVWAMLNKEIEIDASLMSKKLQFDLNDLKLPTKKQFEALEATLPVLPDYAQVVKDVKKTLEGIF